MQKLCSLAVFVMIGTGLLYAKPKVAQSNGYIQANVLSVQKEDVQSPATMSGTSPTDAPLQSQYYAYNVFVHAGCATYVGRYETPFEYFPSAFSPNHTVEVRLTKHLMYFNVPGDREMKMAIVQHKNDAAGCGGN